MWRTKISMGVVGLVLATCPHICAQDPGWPRQLVKPGGGTLIAYQPQVDNWAGFNIPTVRPPRSRTNRVSIRAIPRVDSPRRVSTLRGRAGRAVRHRANTFKTSGGSSGGFGGGGRSWGGGGRSRR
jgi:uncharacterized membrane protein YgcG